MTKLFGVLGWPVKHSASPAMMAAAFSVLGEDAVYLHFAVKPEDFHAAIRGLQALGAVGVNITIPHKQAAWTEMDELSPEAKLAEAVNTVRFNSDGRLQGHNTDVRGWWNSVEPYLGSSDGKVAVFGNGGAARGILAALSLYRSGSPVAVIGRDAQRARQLAGQFKNELNVEVAPWTERHEVCASAKLIVNATPLGMWPKIEESVIEDAGCLSAGQVVQDAVYRPQMTKLLRMAKSRGAVTVGGLSMLAGQGALALEFWLCKKAPYAVMLSAAQDYIASNP